MIPRHVAAGKKFKESKEKTKIATEDMLIVLSISAVSFIISMSQSPNNDRKASCYRPIAVEAKCLLHATRIRPLEYVPRQLSCALLVHCTGVFGKTSNVSIPHSPYSLNFFIISKMKWYLKRTHHDGVEEVVTMMLNEFISEDSLGCFKS